uniref:Transposase n=1 Tax=candidate division WOR-3 bacterium TaxID=2052148 RepID=A0A7V3RGK6_UNCW3
MCREHKISQTLYYRWRDKFLESGMKDLSMAHLMITTTKQR